MGLLQKTQEKKINYEKNEEEMGLLTKAKLKKKSTELNKEKLDKRFAEKKPQEEYKVTGLLEKAKQKKEDIKTVQKPAQKKTSSDVKNYNAKGKELIEEKTAFGWKGLGTRRIVFDHDINEYLYEIEEPKLNDDEKETKVELSRLFKMLANIDVTNSDKAKKEKYLEDTLEKIIIDNDISFGPKRKIEKKGKLTIEKKFKVKEKKIKKSVLTRKELTKEEQISKDKIFYEIYREFLGYGKIDIPMNDEGIEDISCDGHHVPIFIYHKKYDAITTNIRFDGEGELNSFVVRLAQVCGKQISIYSPIVDGKLPDGSRLQTTLARTVTKGSTFTIRKFKENPLTPIDLIRFKSLSPEMAAYFWMAIEKGASMLLCGGTASGKTTALNALSLFIPSQHKIISIEDTREVNLPHQNWIAGTTREGFSSAAEAKTGKDIDMFDLIRAALRQRPKVVIVGEVRGKEAYSLFQAMATGHTSYATVHASDIHTLIQRLENPPISLPRALLTSLDIIVFQNAVDINGKMVRRMTSVTEVVKLDSDTNQLIFMEPFRWCSKTDDRFESSGASKILNNIRLQNDWNEEKLEKEIQNRKKILEWMDKNNIRDYREVGRIVADYSKYPEEILKMVKEDRKK